MDSSGSSGPAEFLRARVLARNATLNFIGQLLPMLVALFAIPYTIHHLGTTRFGILAIAWVVVGYFSLFDLGLGRASTKYVAEALGRGQREQIPKIIWTSLLFVVSAGLVGGVTLLCLTPVILRAVMQVPSHLYREAQLVFDILSASILVTLASSSLGGVLEAYQRFDVINLIKVPSNALTHLIPALVLALGGGLPTIVLMLVVKNGAVLAVQFLCCLKVVPLAPRLGPVDLALAPSLFTFGGWILVANATVAVLQNFDRLLVAALLSLSAVTYYTAPYELVNRAGIIPSSIMVVLFPAFSSLQGSSPRELDRIVARAIKYLAAIMGAIIGFVIAFSREILLFWLGKDFLQSTAVMQILAIGVFLSSLAWLAGTLLQASGHPKVVTMIHIWQIPVYFAATWGLVNLWGIRGAAVSWTLRVLISLVFLLAACWKRGLLGRAHLLQGRTPGFLLLIGALAMLTAKINSSLQVSWTGICISATAFALILIALLWTCILNVEERHLVLCAVNHRSPRI